MSGQFSSNCATAISSTEDRTRRPVEDSIASSSPRSRFEGRNAIRFAAAGETLQVASARPETIAALRAFGHPGEIPARTTPATYDHWIKETSGVDGACFIVERNGHTVFRAPDEQWIIDYLEAVVGVFTSQTGESCLCLHAGAVSRRAIGIVLPGESHSGKSTLTLSLLQKGCGYFSDNLATVQPGSLLLTSQTRHLSVRPDVFPLFPELDVLLHSRTYSLQPGAKEKAFVPLAMLTQSLHPTPCVVGLIVFPRFQRDASLAWQRLDRDTATRRLLQLSFDLRRNTQERIKMSIEIAQRVDCFTVTFADAREAADSVLRVADSRARRGSTA